MAQKSFASTSGMSDACQQALRNLLIACSDTKLLLGFHYGEWTFGPPEIEAAIACCSLCQTELGHVRLFHGILNKHFGDDPDALVEERASTEFANVAYLDKPIKDWAEFVAANYVVDLAVTVVLHAMKDSTFKPLHMSLDKMLQEERYHLHHGQGWFRTLASRNDVTRKAIAKTASRALRTVVEWFGPPDSAADKELVQAGIKTETDQSLLNRYLAELGALANSLDVDLGLAKTDKGWRFPQKIEWNGWNASTRRLTASGPDENILYHLRGSKNKVFKLG